MEEELSSLREDVARTNGMNVACGDCDNDSRNSSTPTTVATATASTTVDGSTAAHCYHHLTTAGATSITTQYGLHDNHCQ